ncbi:MAG: hypothetical protein ACHP9S_05010 [Terriglobales bacterium]|jgi:hypothetical protein
MTSESRKREALHSESEGQVLLNPQQLLPGVDYLYCSDCGHHVGSIRLQPGVWEVQCSRCVGECGLCGCKTTGTCHGKDGVPVQTHTYVSGKK